MPPKRTQRSQLRLANMLPSMESFPASLSQITPIPTEHISVLPEDEIDDDDQVETQVHEEARDPDHEDEHEDEDDSTLPETDDKRGRDDILSKITKDDQQGMREHYRMVLKLRFKQHAEWKEDRTRMVSHLDRCRATNRPENPANWCKIFKMVDALRYCGGAKELDEFLQTIQSNFASHKHRFQEAIPIKSSMQSLFSTPGITTQIRLSDRRTIQTHTSGIGTYERPRTRDYRTSNFLRTSFKRCTEIEIGITIQPRKPCRSTSNYKINQSDFMATASKQIGEEPAGAL